jgi:hypothetical protein
LWKRPGRWRLQGSVRVRAGCAVRIRARRAPWPTRAEEANVGLVDERGGLEGVIDTLAAHCLCGEAVEFGVEGFEDLLAGAARSSHLGTLRGRKPAPGTRCVN